MERSRIAIGIGLVWALGVLSLGLALGALGQPLALAAMLVAAALPAVLLWSATRLLDTLDEIIRRVDTLSKAAPARPGSDTGAATGTGAGTATATATDPTLLAFLDKLSERQRLTDRALVSLLEGRAEDRTILSRVAETTQKAATAPAPAPRPAPPLRSNRITSHADGQPNLPLPLAPEEEDTRPEDRDWDTALRALNFPEDERDKAGFRALSRARKDRTVGHLLRASEDVLNLLSQDGIYVDDLDPEPTDPALWRRFAGGERGASLRALAGIDDATAVTLTQGRMRSDPVMRDAALHFMRRYDIVLKEAVEAGLEDDGLARLSDTRTGRAFMLIGAVAGTFE